ncbi:MAG: sigma-70 family RNA polymerase sigma factor [Candidatus Bipolaricaulia bacterium]
MIATETIHDQRSKILKRRENGIGVTVAETQDTSLKDRSKTTEELLNELSESPEVETLIIEQNIGLVKAVARRFLNSGEPYEDLVQTGCIGLLNAIHNFDPERGVKFSTYATHLIRGEIRHYIRKTRSFVRVPRWLQRLNERVKRTEEKLFKENGKLPTTGELAKAFNIEEEGVIEVMKARKSMYYVSLDEKRQGLDGRPRIDIRKIRSKIYETFKLPIEDRIKIAIVIEKLSEIQQKVIQGLFYEGKTQKEVGDEIGYSQRHVSRLKNQALQEIKKQLEHSYVTN